MSNFEQVPLDYLAWKGVSSREMGFPVKGGVYREYIEGPGDMVTERRFVQIPDSSQYVDILSVDDRPIGPKGGRIGPTVLKFQTHNYRIDELSERKTQIHAHHMGARVLDIELPGVVMDYARPLETKGGRMAVPQFIESFSGNFDSLSLAQLRAADKVARFEDGDEIQVYGESLGAYSAVALARALAMGRYDKRLYITDMTVVEPVNAMGNRSILDQLKLATERLGKIEHQRRLVYLSENTEIGHPMTMFEMLNDTTAIIDKKLKARLGQSIAAAASGAGLRKGLEGALFGALERDSTDGPRLRDANITFVRGRESTVTLARDMAAFADEAQEKGLDIRLVEFSSVEGNRMPAGHSQLDSLGRMAEAALYMAHVS